MTTEINIDTDEVNPKSEELPVENNHFQIVNEKDHKTVLEMSDNNPQNEVVVESSETSKPVEDSAPSNDLGATNKNGTIQNVEGLKNEKENIHNFDENLPKTVQLLRTPDGGKLYLVGTAHFSAESQDDVSKVIQAVKPHSIMVELCKSRLHVLLLDEKTILEQAKSPFKSFQDTLKQHGIYNGLMYILLLKVTAHVTKELGMAPGGEFRRAFAEAQKLPKCVIHMGDRPINVTLQRALNALSWWQTLKFGWLLMTSNYSVTKEMVERYKHSDVVEQVLAELTEEFPVLGEVFVRERDLFLTYSLQMACVPQRTSTGLVPARVVGIVGIGHMMGIIQNWGKVTPSDIEPIMRIPPPTLFSKILRFSIRVSLMGTAAYVVYKVVPLPSSFAMKTIKSSVEGLLKVSGAR